jgi:DNA helicase-2/ATP-dependent DNA helicase PcrA
MSSKKVVRQAGLTIASACEKRKAIRETAMKKAPASAMMAHHSQIDYAAELNPSQLEAVMVDEGPLLVIAGAGSGKTRTLTYRVARLIEKGVSPRSILLLTFTRKASQEMLRRASSLLDLRCQQVAGGTFHSLAFSLLRRFGSLAGFTAGFSILDRSDAEQLVSMLRKQVVSGIGDARLPKARTLVEIFSRSASKQTPVDVILTGEYPQFTSQIDVIAALQHRYIDHKGQQGFMDYDDLLTHLHRLLRDHASLRRHLADVYRFVMVDEYQDTNIIQAEILRLLVQDHGNIMVVGDDSQSIYAFRGAHYRNILDFPSIFPGTRIVKLEENYRSVQPILDLTNALIAQARSSYPKKLFTRRGGGRQPALITTDDEDEQSRFVVDTVKQLDCRGIGLERMAVLFRASYHSFALEIELTREKIPFVKSGGFKFMEAAHIKDMLAHLRVMAYPRERLSWFRILMLLEKVGPKTAERLLQTLGGASGDWRQVLATKPGKAAWAKGLAKLQELFLTLEERRASVAKMGESVLQYYRPLMASQFDDYPKREKDLQQMLAIMERYTDLDAFLSDMALEPPDASIDGKLQPFGDDEPRLVLSTVHSAKGLEWDVVFVIWALDGRFPSLYAFNDEEALEEELRLMYVAATRAKQHLFFITPMGAYDRGLGTFLFRPSRFLEKIPSARLKRFRLAPEDDHQTMIADF